MHEKKQIINLTHFLQSGTNCIKKVCSLSISELLVHLIASNALFWFSYSMNK